MSKVITIRLNDEELSKLEKLQDGKTPAETFKFILKNYKEVKGVEIPSYKVTKDEIAEFLGISKFDKRWNTFMDKITKIYDENKPNKLGV